MNIIKLDEIIELTGRLEELKLLAPWIGITHTGEGVEFRESKELIDKKIEEYGENFKQDIETYKEYLIMKEKLEILEVKVFGLEKDLEQQEKSIEHLYIIQIIIAVMFIIVFKLV